MAQLYNGSQLFGPLLASLSPESTVQLLERLPVAVLLLDGVRSVTFANAVASALLRLAPEAIAGLPEEALWGVLGGHPDPQSTLSTHFPESRGVIERLDDRGQPSVLLVQEIAVNLGEKAQVLLLLHDVSQLAAERLALEECRDRFHTFMEHLPGVAYMKDRDGRYVYVSPTFQRHFGQPVDFYVGRLDRELWPAEVIEQLRASDAVVLEKRTVVQATERVPQSDGTHYWLSTKFPILGSGGEVVLIGGVAVDVTEERRALESLKELQRTAQQRERLADVGAITAQILHDLANPIAGLSMQVQLILRRAGREPDRPLGTLLQSLARLFAEVQRLDTLLREFKDFAREQRLELEPVRLRPFLAECAAQWRPVARARDIALHADLSSELPIIQADPEQLRRVIDNLVKNAIEAIERGPGSIWIHSMLRKPKLVRISVVDDGPGIAPHVEPFRLFETTKPYGTGLGLPIVRQIVEAHGGSIQFEPRDPRGVAFHVDLPEHGPTWPASAGGLNQGS
ncbi:MAG: hypothetical protein KatS3mg077_2119 [Candidatus Binatia bacterium]|nr:MAG: hypothetical protein KatS3mg077_2119 [Candidatus Binatia bacterium]